MLANIRIRRLLYYLVFVWLGLTLVNIVYKLFVLGIPGILMMLHESGVFTAVLAGVCVYFWVARRFIDGAVERWRLKPFAQDVFSFGAFLLIVTLSVVAFHFLLAMFPHPALAGAQQ